jgi:hypothetical protein
VPRKTSSASRASPTVPLTYRSSPAWAPERNSACERPCTTGTSPNTVMQMFSGPWVVSPPISSQPCASASASRPCETAPARPQSACGRARARVKARGLAPQAARSLRLTASALCPSLRVHRRQRNAAPPPACRWRWPLGAGAGLQQRTVVAHAQHRRAHRALEIALDQVKFAHDARFLGLDGRLVLAKKTQGRTAPATPDRLADAHSVQARDAVRRRASRKAM